MCGSFEIMHEKPMAQGLVYSRYSKLCAIAIKNNNTNKECNITTPKLLIKLIIICQD